VSASGARQARTVTVDVAVAGGAYPVHIGRSLLGRLGDLSPKLGAQAVIVCDDVVAPLYLELARQGLGHKGGPAVHSVVVPAGENRKNQETLTHLYERLYDLGVGRRDTVVALGGGVIGDMAGYAAATFLRGVRLVQVPTTLLAMVDAAVGGKVAVDFREGKNYLGTFYQPGVVVEDLETLATLPAQQVRNGWTEIIKHGFLGGGALLNLAERSLAPGRGVDEQLVAGSVRLKAAVVGSDERESTGAREVLNLGHTLGHAVEAAGRFTAYSHGEAVALGLRAALWLSVRLTGLAPADDARGQRLLSAAGLPERLERVADGDVLRLVSRDKKAVAGKARFVLLARFGEPLRGIEVEESMTEEAVRWLTRR
jgi:3-dehydroquinate synthase